MSRLSRFINFYTENTRGKKPPQPSYKEVTVTGISPLTLVKAVAQKFKRLTQYGKCEQPAGTMNTAITQYGTVEQRNLPQGYTELEYIESDGTAYIDLGFKLTQDDDIEVDFALTTSQATKYIFGSRGSDASANNIALFFASTANKVVADFNNSDYSLYRAGPSDALTTGVKYSAVLNKNKRGIYNGATTIVENTTVCADTIETAGNAAIFGGFYQNGAVYTAYNFTGRIYRVTIAGKHDLRPAKNSSDVVGMYDLVTGQFFTNAGTGTFTAGTVATPTPGRPIDIVTNNGVLRYGQYGKNLFDLSTVTLNSYINASGVITQDGASMYSALVPVSPNASYTLSGTTVQGSGNKRVHAYDANGDWLEQLGVASNVVAGVSYAVHVTTTVSTAYIRISVLKSDINVQVEAGSTATAYEPYHFGIYTDGTPETLTIMGKNLFDASAITTGIRLTDTGTETSESYGFVSAQIPVAPNTAYTYSQNTGSSVYLRICEYSAEGTLVYLNKYSTAGAQAQTITTQAGTAFVRCSSDSRFVDNPPQLELGSTVTDFEPYVEPQTVNDMPMLLSVGDYADEAEIISGIKTGKVLAFALKGTESMASMGDGVIAVEAPAFLPAGAIAPLCTHFKGSTDGFSVALNEVCVGFSNMMLFGVDPSWRESDLQNLFTTNYANGTPVIILVPLATETTEQGTAYPQLCNKKYTTASVTAEVSDIQVTFTTGEQTVPTPYSPLPIMCNNGELKWNGTAVVTDGTPETLTVSGKNLYNKANGVLYGYPSASYTWVQGSGVDSELSIMVKLEEGQTYTATRPSGAISAFRIQASATQTLTNGQSLQDISSGGTQDDTVKTFAVPSGYPYVVFYVRNTSQRSTLTIEDVENAFQVELGSTATAYEPYVQPQTVTDIPMLLSVGDYADEAEIINGLLTHKVGVKVCDGTENWTKRTDRETTYQANIISGKPSGVVVGICTHFTFVSSYSALVNGKAIMDATDRIVITYSACEDASAFKSYLAAQYAAGTPVIILYPLANETTEQTPPHELTTAEGTNIVTIAANVDDIELEAVYMAEAETPRRMLSVILQENTDDMTDEEVTRALNIIAEGDDK